MILKASQRGGAAKLAAHLLNEHENEHVEVHEISGFLSGNLKGALNEADAVSSGTKCRQYLFSVILSPPAKENVTIQDYEDAVQRVEEKMGLTGQPRAIIFHEKEGPNGFRRHAHAVWSRIDSREMKAINLPFFKNRLNEVSKSLFLDHGWALPPGYISREHSNPLNYTLAEWQQARRLNDDPKVIKATLKECWAISGNKNAFVQALEQRGFYLARGDRRGFVAVDWRGEVFSLSRSLNQKSKELKMRLGDPKLLPSVEETKNKIDQKLASQAKRLTQDIRQRYEAKMLPLIAGRDRLSASHKQEREQQKLMHQERQVQEAQTRQMRMRKGLRGFWDRLTGRYKRMCEQNEREAREAQKRDQQEHNTLNYRQLQERQRLQKYIENLRKQEQSELRKMRENIFSKLPEKSAQRYRQEFERTAPGRAPGFGLEL